jgi:hypothetical protein
LRTEQESLRKFSVGYKIWEKHFAVSRAEYLCKNQQGAAEELWVREVLQYLINESSKKKDLG